LNYTETPETAKEPTLPSLNILNNNIFFHSTTLNCEMPMGVTTYLISASSHSFSLAFFPRSTTGVVE